MPEHKAMRVSYFVKGMCLIESKVIVDIYETNVHLKLFYLSFLLRADKILVGI